MVNNFVLLDIFFKKITAPSEPFQDVSLTWLNLLIYDNLNVDKDRLDNKQLIVRNYIFKYQQSDINDLLPSTAFSYMC